jgi:PhnB protein
MKSVNPYINFNGSCEEAFNFYQTVFGGKLQLVRYKDMDDQMGLTGDDLNKIANVALPIVDNTILYGSDTPDPVNFGVKAGDQVQINIETESAEEAEHLFNDLTVGGDVKMPLAETEWAERFGILTDKFGIQWMVNYSGEK